MGHVWVPGRVCAAARRRLVPDLARARRRDAARHLRGQGQADGAGAARPGRAAPNQGARQTKCAHPGLAEQQ